MLKLQLVKNATLMMGQRNLAEIMFALAISFTNSVEFEVVESCID